MGTDSAVPDSGTQPEKSFIDERAYAQSKFACTGRASG